MICRSLCHIEYPSVSVHNKEGLLTIGPDNEQVLSRFNIEAQASDEDISVRRHYWDVLELDLFRLDDDPTSPENC